jgi:DNA-binding MarR family transcriptional regulator
MPFLVLSLRSLPKSFYATGKSMSAQLPTSEFEILEQSLQRVMWTEHKKLEQMLTEHDLTLPKFLVLASLIRRGGACPIGQLADDLFQSSPTMTGIVDRLVNDRLVQREREQVDDRRKVTVTLTPQGKQLLARARAARSERMRRALNYFSARDRKEFLRLLTVYMVALEKEPV